MHAQGENRRSSLSIGSAAIVGLLPLILPTAGCAQKLKPIFEELRPPLVWPPQPETPRIGYVGQLRSSADLKPPPKPFQQLGELLAGTETPRQLYGPRSVVRTRDGGRVWVADPGGRCLHGFDLEQRSYTRIEQLGDSHLLSPVGLCLGPGHSIYLCDSEYVAIYHLLDSTGDLLEALRLPDELTRPVAIAYDPMADELLVIDAGTHDVKVLGMDGSLRRILGRHGVAPGEFNYPCDIKCDGELIWVVDAGNHRVQGLTNSGEPVVTFGQPGDALGDFALPKSVAVDSDGHLYVVDARFENVQIFDREGQLLLVLGEEGTGPGEFWLPAGIFIDDHDRIWVCDSYNGRVQVFDYLVGREGREADASIERPLEE